MTNTAISLHNIGKTYKRNTDGDKVSVLNNISFAVNKGECVGIVGPNGSGKTTLLKILSGITKPDTGSLSIKGNVGSMLDVGSGFHPDLTGRENIQLTGKLYGYSSKQIESYEEGILENSGIGSYYYMPLKTYSQGMYLRLAFSMLMTFDMDVYLIDEVLSVGDKDFQQKCALWMQELIEQGKTFVIVSHNPAEIIQHCTRCILLNHGNIIFDGNAAVALEEYYLHIQARPTDASSEIIENVTVQNAPGNEIREVTAGLNLNRVWIDNYADSIPRNMPVTVCFEIEKHDTAAGAYEMFIEVIDLYGATLLTDGIMHTGQTDITNGTGRFVHTCTFPAKMFTPGYYTLNAAFRTASGQLYKLVQVYRLHIVSDAAEEHLPYNNIRRGLRLPMQWQVKKV